MATRKKPSGELPLRFTVNLQEDAPALTLHLFSAGGTHLGSAPVEDGEATLSVPAEFDGRPGTVYLGPTAEAEEPAPSIGRLNRLGAHREPIRILKDDPRFEFTVPDVFWPTWCLCVVKGRLVKRVTLPDGTQAEQPVCNARVTICEVDRFPILIERLPDDILDRLRDDLIVDGPWPPIPLPWPIDAPLEPVPPIDPLILDRLRTVGRDAREPFVPQGASAKATRALPGPRAALSESQLAALRSLPSGPALRNLVIDLADILKYWICHLPYLWSYYTKDCIKTVEVDEDGRFSTVIFHDCDDQPDLWFKVEQFNDGTWEVVHQPTLACGTRWNYECGTEITINLPGARACEAPDYDVPAGVTQFVLPHSIGHTRIWGDPPGSPTAPNGWLRQDGRVTYATGTYLGMLVDAPFGHVLEFRHDDSYFIPNSGIKYYRYSWRRRVPGGPANTGAADTSWTPIATPLARGYRMEYNDGTLPTYESYPVGPDNVGGHAGLFEFKPVSPPPRPTDPSTVVAREWTSGNLSETAAKWDTNGAAPAMSDTNTSDDAGTFEVKIEVFDEHGNQVAPGAGTFSFLLRNADGSTTRHTTPGEVQGGAYVMLVHVDNNRPISELPQPSIGGVAASDDCGFLRYEAGDQIRIRFLADHPNDEAVFDLDVKRGSNLLGAASTTPPYVETASTTAAPYAQVGAFYRHDFAPVDLVGPCVNAAFAAHLRVHGKATNGYHRLGYDSVELIAFALAESED